MADQAVSGVDRSHAVASRNLVPEQLRPARLPGMRPALPGWVTAVVSGGVLFPAVTICQAAGLRGHAGALLFVALAGAVGVRSVPWAAGFNGVLVWMLATGFVVNTGGDLSFRAPDRTTLAVAVLSSLTVCGVSALHRVRTVSSGDLSDAPLS